MPSFTKTIRAVCGCIIVILTPGHSDAQPSWASECPDVKNYKWRLNQRVKAYNVCGLTGLWPRCGSRQRETADAQRVLVTTVGPCRRVHRHTQGPAALHGQGSAGHREARAGHRHDDGIEEGGRRSVDAGSHHWIPWWSVRARARLPTRQLFIRCLFIRRELLSTVDTTLTCHKLHCVSKKGPTLKQYSSKLYGSILMIFGGNI